MWRFLVKYGDAVCRRAQLLHSLGVCARRGARIPSWLWRRALLAPSAAEDLVDFLRFLDPAQPVFLLDVGANRGEWSADFIAVYPDTLALALEPGPKAFDLLSRRFGGDKRFRLLNAAASDDGAPLILRIGADDRLAGAYDYAPEYAGLRDGDGPREETAVSSTRLDDLTLDGAEGRFCVLKIDVQGHEVAVLRGAKRLLERVDAAIIELCFGEEYQDVEPSFAACAALMAEAGLYPAIFQEWGRHAMAYPVERDVIFVRRSLLKKIFI